MAAILGTAVPAAAGDAAIHNHWVTRHKLPVTRGDFSITTGQDGRIYVLGGSDGIADWSTTLIYTPTTNSWASGPDFPGCCDSDGSSVTGPSGKVYIIGGFAGSDVRQYNPATNMWKLVAPIPDGAYHSAAAVTNGLIYVMGGFINVGGTIAVSNVVQVYNPLTNVWSTGPSMHTARDFFVAVTAPSGKIYVFGGGYNAPTTNTVEMFNPGTGAWSFVHKMPVACFTRNGALGPDGRIYIMGCASGSTSTVYAYSPTSDSWTTVAPTPNVDSPYGGAASSGSKLYSVSGYTKLLFGYTP